MMGMMMMMMMMMMIAITAVLYTTVCICLIPTLHLTPHGFSNGLRSGLTTTTSTQGESIIKPASPS